MSGMEVRGLGREVVAQPTAGDLLPELLPDPVAKPVAGVVVEQNEFQVRIVPVIGDVPRQGFPHMVQTVAARGAQGNPGRRPRPDAQAMLQPVRADFDLAPEQPSAAAVQSLRYEARDRPSRGIDDAERQPLSLPGARKSIWIGLDLDRSVGQADKPRNPAAAGVQQLKFLLQVHAVALKKKHHDSSTSWDWHAGHDGSPANAASTAVVMQARQNSKRNAPPKTIFGVVSLPLMT